MELTSDDGSGGTTTWDDLGHDLNLDSDNSSSSDSTNDDLSNSPADDSGSSGAYDRYGPGSSSSGNVMPGKVKSANQGGPAQSEQLETVEEVSNGNIDSHDVTLNDDGSAEFGITGGDVDEVHADPEGNVIDPGQGENVNLPSIAGIDVTGKMLAIGAVVIGALAYLFGGN